MVRAIDRHPVEILNTMVPCALSKTGSHMLSVGININKTIVHLHAPCETQENQEVVASAHMLEATTCVTVLNLIRCGFNPDNNDAKSIRAYLETFPQIQPLLRKTLFGVWIPGNNLSLERVVECEGEIDRTDTRSRVTRVITGKLQRELPKKVGDQFYIVWDTFPECIVPVLTHKGHFGSPHRIATIRNSGKFEVEPALVHDAFDKKIGIKVNSNLDEECLYCNSLPTRSARHATSEKHRRSVTSVIRQAVHFLNTPQILKLLKKG